MGIFFEDTKARPELRQRFLEEIDFGRYKPFVKDVIYFEGSIGDRIMETVPDSCINWLANTTSVIRISDYAFNKYSLEEFNNILIPHEGLHCMQNYFEYAIPSGRGRKMNISKIGEVIFYEKDVGQEREAHRNQINHLTFPKCSYSFQKNVYTWSEFYNKLFDDFLR